MAVNLTVVNSIKFFESASEQDRIAIASLGSLKTCQANELIARSGQVQEGVWFLTHGRLQVKEVADDGRVVRLSILAPEDAVGWLALLDDGFLSHEVIAIEPCQLVIFPTKPLRSVITQSLPLLSNLLGFAAQSIRNSAKERMMLTLPSAFQRVCFQISTLAGQLGNTDSETGGGLPKQHDLAAAANTTRETVSRTLQILAKAGVVRKSGHRVIVRRKDLLHRLASDGLESMPTSLQDIGTKVP
jgi:CRP/FNR family transcriptional regulator, cyclic AMP receptor protein